MRFLLIIFLSFVFLSNAQSQEEAELKQVLVERYLRAVDYVAPFKQGMLEESSRAGRTTPFIDFVVNTPTSTLEYHLSRVFSRHLTLPHALAIAEFYESPTGRYIIEAQKSQPQIRRTPLPFTSEQALVYRAFAQTGAEDAIAHITDDRKVWDEVMAELETARIKGGNGLTNSSSGTGESHLR